MKKISIKKNSEKLEEKIRAEPLGLKGKSKTEASRM